ncbi:hypothetical protein SDC9_80632 [bioreactor metagenome]|uniref:Uncharacterized protein n=1 Tax=bioreactor metagenome TaxID=1076179 RepID=A0A644Z200_9ZZZZ
MTTGGRRRGSPPAPSVVLWSALLRRSPAPPPNRCRPSCSGHRPAGLPASVRLRVGGASAGSDDAPAAVTHQHGAGDVGGIVAQQEGDGGRELVGGRRRGHHRAEQRSDHLGEAGRVHPGPDVGGDTAGRDAVAADPLACVEERGGLRQTDDRVLRGGVRDAGGRASDAGLRGDVDDGTRPAGQHHRDRGATHPHHRGHVHVEDPLPGVVVDLGDGEEVVHDAGVVDQPPQFGAGLGDHPVDDRLVGDRSHDIAEPGAAELLGDVLEPLLGQVDPDDVRPLGDRPGGGGPPDAGSGTGHDDGPTGEAIGDDGGHDNLPCECEHAARQPHGRYVVPPAATRLR